MAHSQQSKHTSSTPDWRNVPVTNVAQLGGIETGVLDNGPGRGVRYAWVNTGGGLRYRVLIDRGLDIADAEFLGQSLTWHSPTGITAPRAAFNRGLEWLRSFYGGLVVGCGPLNVGGPFEEEGQQFGLHGSHSNTMATVESIVNPDLARGQYEMSISGVVRTARVFGPNIDLKRTISSTLGVPGLRITDEFTNRGDQTAPLCWLLHINLGYPLLEPEASTFCWRGKINPLKGSEEWFLSGGDCKTAPQPLEKHRGSGEFCTYIDPATDAEKNVLVGVVNRRRGFGLMIEFSLAEYDRLVNWQHWAPGGAYVGALEPSISGIEGRAVDDQRGWLSRLEPGESRTLRCHITATNDEADLKRLLALND